MKRSILRWLSLALCMPVFNIINAQPLCTGIYNNVYQYSDNTRLAIKPVDMVNCDVNNVCILGTIGRNWTDTFSLKKLDIDGNTIFDKTYATSSFGARSYFLRRMIKTMDDGFIIAGYRITYANVINPFAAKFDASGNPVWNRTYHCNDTLLQVNWNFDQLDIERIQDEEDEELYFIHTVGQAEVINDHQEGVLSVIKIDGATGNPAWNFQYTDLARDDYYYYEDMPQTMVYIPRPNGNSYYFLAGIRVEYTPTNGLQYTMYQMGISKYGSIVLPYRHMPIPSYPFNLDAVYDANTEQIVMTYTLGDHSTHKSSTSVSQVGIMLLNPGDLGINLARYFWQGNPPSYESYSSRIKITADGDYIVSSFLTDRTTFSATPILENITMLKVTPSLTPIFWNRYNLLSNIYADCLPLVITECNGVEHYVMAGSIEDPMNGNIPNMRVLSTDQYGDVCGRVDGDTDYEDHEPEPTQLQYEITEKTGYDSIIVAEIYPDINTTQCDLDMPDYRVAQAYTGPDYIRITPSVLTNEYTISINCEMATDAEVNVRVFSIAGTLVAENTVQAPGGNSSFGIDVSGLAPGTYIAVATNTASRQVTRKKIVKM